MGSFGTHRGGRLTINLTPMYKPAYQPRFTRTRETFFCPEIAAPQLEPALFAPAHDFLVLNQRPDLLASDDKPDDDRPYSIDLP